MLFNTTVFSSSPLLSYVPQILWSEGNESDPHLVSSFSLQVCHTGRYRLIRCFKTDYATQSYRSTNGQLGNATVSFRWNGTGIWFAPFLINKRGSSLKSVVT